MKRKIISKLENWKKSKNRKPLIINGARQVGKTYSVLEFAKQNYENFIYINFEFNEIACKIFEKTLDPKEIIETMSIAFKTNILPEKTLIFLDEIQNCEKALTSLKYFYENAKEYHIIAAGSLLGVAINRKNYSFPVGKVETITLNPMDFEEFLWANEQEELAKKIRECFEKDERMNIARHELALNLYDKYLVIGGMPEVVYKYINEHNIIFAQQTQGEIINNYISDMAKYATNTESVKIRAAYNSIPMQLAKENKKFQYKIVQTGGTATIFGASIDWLLQSGVILKCNKLIDAQMPISAYQDLSSFKIYMSDVGLLTLKSNMSYEFLLDKDDSNNNFMGALVENYVAQALNNNGYDLFYWTNKGTAEVDFIIQKGKDIIPVEVKAGKNVTAKSLNIYIESKKPKYSVRISRRNFGFENNIKSVPLYAVFCI